MILFVDNEHSSGYDASYGEMILAARSRITYRLQDMTGEICLLQRYHDVSPKLIQRFDIKAMFISGNGSDAEVYDPQLQEGLRSVIRAGSVPIFGFCGGHQLIAETFGVPIERIGKIPEGEEDPNPEYAPGWVTESGYRPVSLDRRAAIDHPLLAGLAEEPVVRHAHAWEIKSLPRGFVNLGGTDMTPIQIMADVERMIVGTQFHPEYWTDENPAGEQLIRNFCSMAGLLGE
ncbi:MAG: gamma-glutamyl-gamma-aminobutyrate hydrolase family protein [Acidimicrobiales bacterium]